MEVLQASQTSLLYLNNCPVFNTPADGTPKILPSSIKKSKTAEIWAGVHGTISTALQMFYKYSVIYINMILVINAIFVPVQQAAQ